MLLNVLLHLFAFSCMPWKGCELRSLKLQLRSFVSPAPLKSYFRARRPLKEMPASCSCCSWRFLLCTLDGWFCFSWLSPCYESSITLALGNRQMQKHTSSSMSCFCICRLLLATAAQKQSVKSNILHLYTINAAHWAAIAKPTYIYTKHRVAPRKHIYHLRLNEPP